MIRKAFLMQVHPGREAEYEKRHNPIWPELEQTLLEYGVKTYSIFFDSQTHCLFGYVEIEDEDRWNAIAKTDICQKWWAYMKDIMPSNPDNSPVQRPLREVFHIDSSGASAD
jgi:L-rhamnose mutarotase